jgi:hypothetical protein
MNDRIITHYRSPNRHCHLYISLAEEVLKLYAEEALIEELRCMKQGDEECEILDYVASVANCGSLRNAPAVRPKFV